MIYLFIILYIEYKILYKIFIFIYIYLHYAGGGGVAVGGSWSGAELWLESAPGAVPGGELSVLESQLWIQHWRQ